MSVSFVRIDDRMIHGQTCTRWAREYPCDGLIAVNDKAATNDVLKAMQEDTGIELRCLKVDGGASQNDFLMQFQSDISNCKVHRPQVVETTALGAAYMAGLATGFWASKEEIKNNWKLNYEFVPRINKSRREKSLEGWAKAVRFALMWKDA